MKKFCLPLLVTLFLAACADSPRESQPATESLTLRTDDNPQWSYENLRLYPVVLADGATPNAVAASLKTLREGMELPGFRITERKQFGRSPDAVINALTVQHRGTDSIFLMSGDVVTGGNQDRVIAHDELIVANSVRNIEVFCVEQGRWSYYDSTASESERQVAAFRGYYNVASPEVRHAVAHSGQQHDVWAAVGRVTAANNAAGSTGTYAALETGNEQKNRREAYLRFFDGKFTDLPNVVGLVAVYNGEVRAVDIFGHPDLFRRQLPALLHGYVVEAAASGATTQTTAAEAARHAFETVAALAHPDATSTDAAGRFAVRGQWVHLFKK